MLKHNWITLVHTKFQNFVSHWRGAWLYEDYWGWGGGDKVRWKLKKSKSPDACRIRLIDKDTQWRQTHKQTTVLLGSEAS